MIRRCFGDDCGKRRVNGYGKFNTSLLLANVHNTVTYVLSAYPNYITASLAGVEQQCQG